MTPDPKDATLRARVRAAIETCISDPWAGPHRSKLIDAVLAAIPEPAPAPEPRRVVKIGNYSVTLDHELYVLRDCMGAFVKESHSAAAIVTGLLPEADRDEKVLELLALRDGPDAKDAQIAALNIECLERAGTALALTEQIATLTKRLGVERDAVAFWREQCDVRERGLKTVEAELAELRAEQRPIVLSVGHSVTEPTNDSVYAPNAVRELIAHNVAALKAKAGTPTWWVNVYDDNQVVIHSTEARARNGAVAAVKRVAVPLYEAVP